MNISGTRQQPTNTNSSIQNQEDRSNLLRDAVTMAMNAAHGLQKLDEQYVGQVLGTLVRSKLLGAEDSYRLKDKVLDQAFFEKALDSRIEVVLQRKGLISSPMIEMLHGRLTNLEARFS